MVRGQERVHRTQSTAAISKLAGYGLSKIVPGLLGLVTIPFWVRTFGEGAYATYSILWVVSNFAAAVSVGWLRQSILRYSGHEQLNPDRIPKLVIATSVSVSAIPLAVAIFLLAHAGTDFFWILTVGIAFCLLNGGYLIEQARAQSEERVKRYSGAEIVRASVALLASAALHTFFHLNPVVCMIGAYLVATVLSIMVIRHRPSSGASSDRSVVQAYWTYGWPMSIWLALSQVLVYFDRLFLAPSISAKDLGAYAATSDLIVRGVGMAAFPLTMYVHPLIMRHWNSGRRKRALAMNSRAMFAIAGFSVACVLAVAFFGQSVISRLLDIAAPEPVVIILLALGAGLWQLALQSHKPLEMMNRTRLMTVMLAGTCVLTLGSLATFTAQYGEVAAAATFASGAAVYVFGTLALSRTIGRREVASDKTD